VTSTRRPRPGRRRSLQRRDRYQVARPCPSLTQELPILVRPHQATCSFHDLRVPVRWFFIRMNSVRKPWPAELSFPAAARWRAGCARTRGRFSARRSSGLAGQPAHRLRFFLTSLFPLIVCGRGLWFLTRRVPPLARQQAPGAHRRGTESGRDLDTSVRCSSGCNTVQATCRMTCCCR